MQQQAPLELCQVLSIEHSPLLYVDVEYSLATRAGVVKGNFVEAQDVARVRVAYNSLLGLLSPARS